MLSKLLAKLTLNAVTIVLIVGALIVQTARIEGFKFWPFSVTGYKAEWADAKARLRALTDASERQKAETERRIAEAAKHIVYIDRTVTELENRPLPQACATPDVKEWGAVL